MQIGLPARLFCLLQTAAHVLADARCVFLTFRLAAISQCNDPRLSVVCFKRLPVIYGLAPFYPLSAYVLIGKAKYRIMNPMIATNVSFHTNTQMDLLTPWYEHRFRTLGIYNRKTLLADLNHRAVSS